MCLFVIAEDVRTVLENPTRYHVIQKQKYQVHQYLSESIKRFGWNRQPVANKNIGPLTYCRTADVEQRYNVKYPSDCNATQSANVNDPLSSMVAPHPLLPNSGRSEEVSTKLIPASPYNIVGSNNNNKAHAIPLDVVNNINNINSSTASSNSLYMHSNKLRNRNCSSLSGGSTTSPLQSAPISPSLSSAASNSETAKKVPKNAKAITDITVLVATTPSTPLASNTASANEVFKQRSLATSSTVKMKALATYR
ncbi:hypothetical protein GQX74_013105 [Glossina fuscipes]|nr:hypothetical protein GQX74_013105 [Glossina fuscipes]